MKYLSVIFSLCFILLLGVQVQAQHDHGKDSKAHKTEKKAANETTDIFVVYGNCGICKKTIEGSLNNVDGISSAIWDVETKVMTVKYDNEAIKLDDIKKKIADVGYDSDKFRAKDETYNNLMGCCQYERPSN
jgi:periplasmic mercuric ion binding protein